jgi:hypothetical protein
MADMLSILSSAYKVAGTVGAPSSSKYVAVDPALYQGTWTGTYPDNKTFNITVSNVTGFHAQVKYQSGSTVKYQSVLIKDQGFRVGDTKLTLTQKLGTAQVKNAVTDPTTGSTYLDTAVATRT